MAVEELIFAIISFALFILMFTKMIKKNDTSYLSLIILQALGITLDFFEVIFKVKINLIFMILKYILAIFIPILVIYLEKRNIPFIELFDVLKSIFYLTLGDNK